MANETNEKVPDGAYTTAAQLLDKGQTPAAVEQQLVASGISPELAKRIVADQSRASAALATSDGRTEMRVGLVTIGASLLVMFMAGFLGVLVMIAGAVIFFLGLYKQRKRR